MESDDDDEGDGGYRIEPSQSPIHLTGVKYQQLYLYCIHTIFLSSLTRALFFSGESQYTHATQDTDHGAPQSQRETITDQDRQRGTGREGEDNIIFPWRRARLLKIQVALRPMPIDSTLAWPPIPYNWSKMCNESMSIRI
jgi:hypothetical protein